jgi:hypothetical protein
MLKISILQGQFNKLYQSKILMKQAKEDKVKNLIKVLDHYIQLTIHSRLNHYKKKWI